ncbi:MAG: hypothetical protein JSW27_08970 [Phycisphaerales bacterium]|nr:MAG: hypothetical protein JSW27_08970 [Phycisphaerales bacterium]
MARLARVVVPGIPLHVTQRGNRLTMAVTDSSGTSMHSYTYDNLFVRWEISSANGDQVSFYIDDTWRATRSGIAGWVEVTEEITTSGTHTLKWVYDKDSSGSSGSDCAWVDYVHFGAGAPVSGEGVDGQKISIEE